MTLIYFILNFEYWHLFNKSNNKMIDVLTAHTALAIPEVTEKEDLFS